VAERPTVYIIASDQHRNGKTLLSRLLADYLMLDARDPFLIDTDAPSAPLRAYFPGRTRVADLAHVQGQIKVFDTILASTGRDYVIDLTSQHTDSFLNQIEQLNYFAELRTRSFQTIIFFIVDNSLASLRYYQDFARRFSPTLRVPIRNDFVGSALPAEEASFEIPILDAPIMATIAHRHFSIREYVLGDPQNIPHEQDIPLKRFVLHIMQAFTDLQPLLPLAEARKSLRPR
jgi:hypothetical protein